MSPRRESGSTLIELLAATVILSVISFALTESVISGFRNTGDTETRLAGSVDRQRVAAAFVPDVQSVQTYIKQASNEVLPCSGNREPEAGNEVHELGWIDGFDNNVALYFGAVVDGQSKLVRRLCVNGSSTGDDEVLAEISGALDIGSDDQGLTFALKMGCPSDPLDPCPDPDYQVVAKKRAAGVLS